MTRYIDADELEKRTVLVEGDEFDGEYVIPYASFEMLPTVDAVSVVHAHWESYSNPYALTPGGCPYVRCSRCHGDGSRHLGGPEGYLWTYCPCCGAKMDEKTEEKVDEE